MPTHLEKRYTIYWSKRPVPNDLISDYKSFLRHREYLPFMRYNAKVMYTLVRLMSGVFWTGERINRLSLMQVTRDYWNQNKFPEGEKLDFYNKSFHVAKTYRKPLLEKTHAILMQFALDVLCADKLPVSEGQTIDMMSLANAFLKGQELSEVQIIQMLDKLKEGSENGFILKRILAYPKRNERITLWVKYHFQDNELRYERANMIGWLLNEDPDYQVTQELLMEDFEYANARDKQIISEHLGEQFVPDVLDDTFPGVFRKLPEPKEGLEPIDITFPLNPFGEEEDESESMFDNFASGHYYQDTELLPSGVVFSKRFFYNNSFDNSYQGLRKLPDFKKMVPFFYSNLETTRRVTMLWAYYYSHLSPAEKRRKMKTIYQQDVHRTLFKICVRMKDVRLMDWLGEQKKVKR